MDNIKLDTIPEIGKDNKIFINDIELYNCYSIDNGNIKGNFYNIESGKEDKFVIDINKNLLVLGYKNIKKNNLIPLNMRTEEEKKRISNQGILKREQRREEKKNFNELAKAMLEQSVSEKQIKAVLGDNTECLLDNSVASVILASMINGAVNGSFKCAEFVRDTAGYKPKNEVELQADIMTESDKALIEKLSKRIG